MSLFLSPYASFDCSDDQFDVSSVYVYVSDAEKNVFQKVKVYQRGNGKIICDKNHLETGTYYYTMFVDGEEVDTQKLEIKKKL